MKCKYCNADIEQDAQFCTNCGKDLSKFKRCIKCGELLDSDAVFCPYCGTEQSKKVNVNEQNNQQGSSQESLHEVVEDALQTYEEKKSRKWLWAIIVVILLTIIGGGVYSYDMINGKKMLVTGSDSTIVEVANSPRTDPEAAKDFIENMYKDLYEPFKLYDERRYDETLLSKYFTKEAMRKFYDESMYEEGVFFYCTDFLVNGSMGAARPDYGNKVVSRTIEHEDNDWYLVTNIWDVIQEPVKVHLMVKKVGGEIKVVDIRAEDASR